VLFHVGIAEQDLRAMRIVHDRRANHHRADPPEGVQFRDGARLLGPIGQLMLAERISGPHGTHAAPTRPRRLFLRHRGTAHAVALTHLIVGAATSFANQDIAGLGQ